nr:MoxR family ATPase [Microbacterium sp. KUDC0406]
MTDDAPSITAEQFAAQTSRIIASVSAVIDGKPDAVRSALVCLLAEGHLLIEDVPGVGKTMLARALAASVDATVRRIQFTPICSPATSPASRSTTRWSASSHSSRVRSSRTS